MYCTSCGKEVREGATFCTSCGAKINSNATTMKRKKKQSLIVVAIAIVVLVFGGVFTTKVIIPNMGQPEEQHVAETETQKSDDIMSSAEGTITSTEDVKVAVNENTVESESTDEPDAPAKSEIIVEPETVAEIESTSGIESETEPVIDSSYVYELYRAELESIKQNGLFDLDGYYYMANQDLYYGYYDLDQNGVKELLFRTSEFIFVYAYVDGELQHVWNHKGEPGGKCDFTENGYVYRKDELDRFEEVYTKEYYRFDGKTFTQYASSYERFWIEAATGEKKTESKYEIDLYKKSKDSFSESIAKIIDGRINWGKFSPNAELYVPSN